jgi:hypothetical protein
MIEWNDIKWLRMYYGDDLINKMYIGDTLVFPKNGSNITLPTPFNLNLNAKEFYSVSNTFPNAETADIPVGITLTGTPTVHSDYISVSSDCWGQLSGYQSNFNISSNDEMTVIFKVTPTNQSNYGNVLANRNSSYNWMARVDQSNAAYLHGSASYQNISVTVSATPNIVVMRVSGGTLTVQSVTDNTTSTGSWKPGRTNNDGVSLFSGYYDHYGEQFIGDFYWLYQAKRYLTDEEVQDVITYNENL